LSIPVDIHEGLAALESLLARAGGRRRLVSVTAPVEIEDPSAAVFGARMAGDRWFCWEEPDADGFALATLGSAHEGVSRGAARFDDVAGECAALVRDRIAEEPVDLPAGAGPVWTGGFAFAPDGGREPHWSSFPPALMVLPELSLHRRGETTLLTLCAIGGAAEASEAQLARLRRRVEALGPGALPLADPHPSAGTTIESVQAPSAYERAVAQAVATIRAGEREKVVLAREVRVRGPAAHDAAAVYGAMRVAFPSCFCFCCGSAEGAFLGASPELLVRRSGAGAVTLALAGSARRSADPAVDDHLAEQLRASPKDRSEHDIVVSRIERLLRRHAVWVEAAEEPETVRVVNIQHLATPIRAQLADPRSAVELAGILHPTPAVGGEPRAEALRAIAELEQLDRGWYAGPVGWMDAAEDGEFCVALRSALLRDRTAHLFAGAGIVADSEPAAELAETELKLDALMPLLAG
jgi:salicylate biosynthesis isochorismate synthase/menaquinone-specific isochorismate synthase